MSFLDELYRRSLDNGNEHVAAMDAEWKEAFPSIHEFLAVTEYDGKPRQPGKLQITSERGLFKVSIIDNGMKAMMSVESISIVLGLTALEHKAGKPDAEWHRWGKVRGARSGKDAGPGTRVGT